jgi:hypothetical protein
MPTMKKKALGELVKCKSSKTFSKLKFPEKPDISRFLTGLHRLLLDMFGP